MDIGLALSLFYMVTGHFFLWLEPYTVIEEIILEILSKNYIQQNTIVLTGAETTVCKHATKR